MKILRATTKLLLFLASTLFIYSLIMLCFIGAPLGVKYQKYRGYLLRTWGKLCCKILGIEVVVNNTPPKPPFLLVSNHLSYADVFVLFSQLRCLFVAKSDVQTWPLIGFIIRTSGILFIDRSRRSDVKRVNELISKNINQNQGIILFPEGTTSPGYEILPLKTSLLQYPASEEFPVTYATVSYQTGEDEKPAYKTICWWDDTPFFEHFLKLLTLKKVKASIHFGSKKIRNKNRKELAKQLKSEMENDFQKVVSKQEFNSKHGEFKPLIS